MNKCFRCGKENKSDNLNSCHQCSKKINQKIEKRMRDYQEWKEQNIINTRFEILDLN